MYEGWIPELRTVGSFKPHVCVVTSIAHTVPAPQPLLQFVSAKQPTGGPPPGPPLAPGGLDTQAKPLPPPVIEPHGVLLPTFWHVVPTGHVVPQSL